MKALPLLFLATLLSCGQAMNQNANQLAAPGTFLITAEQIEKSGARTAWQALQQNAPMFQMHEDRSGRPASLSRRGRSSFILDESPMIFLDGVRIADFRALDNIEAESIIVIVIYDGVEGTTYYGTDAVSGVILIKTKDGPGS